MKGRRNERSRSLLAGRRTLRGRVAFVALVVIGGWLAVLSAAFLIVLHYELRSQSEDLLRARADSAAGTVRLAAGGRVTLIESSTDAALDSGIWIFSGRTAVERPRGDHALQQLADSLVDRGSRFAHANDARLYARPLMQGGRQVGTVVASVSTDPAERAQLAAIAGLAVVAVLLLGGAYPVLRLVGRRALQPVAQMTRQAGEWSANAPQERFRDGHQFVELDELAQTLDGVLDRLSAVLRHERQISGELSHELRTPIARIVAEVDLLLAKEPQNVAYRAIRDSALSMDSIIETLLATARTEFQTSSATSRVHEVVERLAAGRRVPFHVQGDRLVGVEPAVVERMLAPIIDNAARFANTEVRVEIGRVGDRVLVDIANDGPSLAADELEAIFEPGHQGNHTDSHGGAGLGLALARRLARAAEGDVTALAVREGVVFRVSLPPG